MTKRNDIHSPSQIVPQDYQFVAFCPSGLISKCHDLGDALFIQEQRKLFEAHQKQSGGLVASHQHGGSCHCCGASAIYRSIYFHAKSNTYVKIGWICAEKLSLSQDHGANQFKKQAKAARDNIAGKKKAQVLLNDNKLQAAWDVYAAPYCDKYEERTIRDIVQNVVKYGNISVKQVDFVGALVEKIAKRAQIEAVRAAQKAFAADAPNGRFQFSGEVIKTKWQSSQFGDVLKCLLKSESGYMAYGSVPSGLSEIKHGDKISFTARFERSKDDAKFAFFKRPTKAQLIKKVGE